MRLVLAAPVGCSLEGWTLLQGPRDAACPTHHGPITCAPPWASAFFFTSLSNSVSFGFQLKLQFTTSGKVLWLPHGVIPVFQAWRGPWTSTLEHSSQLYSDITVSNPNHAVSPWDRDPTCIGLLSYPRHLAPLIFVGALITLILNYFHCLVAETIWTAPGTWNSSYVTSKGCSTE